MTDHPPSPDALIRVMVADDHPLIRDGIKANLLRDRRLVFVGEAEDGMALLELLALHLPDVLILDLNMPGLTVDPTAYTRALKRQYPALHILVLTAYDDMGLIVGMLRAGAGGYMLKDAVSETMLAAIRRVAAGEIWLPPQLAGSVMQQLTASQSQRSALVHLTQREREVLALAAQEGTVEGVAATLGIAGDTVRTHLKRIYQKIGVHSLAEAILYSIRHLPHDENE